MASIRVWSKQHESVLSTLEAQGRYTARRAFVSLELQEQAPLVLEAYDWLVAHSPAAAARPSDAEYPVWLSYRQDTAMLLSPGAVLLELELDEALITPIHVSKWGRILNYSYVPLEEADETRHRRHLEAQGLSDAKVYLSRFYPALKQEILASWDRLFDPAVSPETTLYYGTVWELRKEWIRAVTR